MNEETSHVERILTIDDNPAIHEDLCLAITGEVPATAPGLAVADSEARTGSPMTTLEVDCAPQGAEGLERLERALLEERPYAVAFVDQRMPPGWDGLKTIEELWAVDPALQVVLCTATPDETWSEVRERFGCTDRLLLLRKPFDLIEARQVACALAAKWRLAREAEAGRCALESANARLEVEIEARHTAEYRLLHEGLHDTLTDLPNRALLCERIRQVLELRLQDPEYLYAVLFLDLDEFKLVNDSHGHAVGDHLLLEISARIQACIRSDDFASRNSENTAARLGGDEFVVLLEGISHEDDAVYVAKRLLGEIGAPVEVDGHELRPSASIGIVQGSVAYEDPMEVLRDADTALYRAKHLGKACYAVFDEEMRREALARMRVESDMRRGLDNDDFFLQYQPIVNLLDGAITGFEALVRWRHPKQGVLPPQEFVPFAEETGLILSLGEWVLRGACAQVAEWRRQGACEGLCVNVNISKKQLDSPDFIEKVMEIFDEYGVDQTNINLELTESILLEAIGHGPLVLQRLEGEELQLYVDDFGTGLSSLAYLNRLPIAAIKLDRSFVATVCGSAASLATVRAMIQMARARDLKLIAEGIETPEQLGLLLELGCDRGQGFLFSRPVDADAIGELLERPGLLRQAG